MANFLAALGAIPDIVKLFRDAFSFFKSIVGDNPKKFIQDAGVIFAKLGEVDENKIGKEAASAARIEAAREIGKLISRL